MENKQEKIGEMADLLSQIFAYSIKDGKITAELKEELQSVKKYVILQKNRYTENINLNSALVEKGRDLPGFLPFLFFFCCSTVSGSFMI